MPEPLLNLKADQSYQLFFELNAAPMLLTDGAHFAIRAVNKAFTTHFGFSEADLLHKPLSSIHADHDQIRLQKMFQSSNKVYADTNSLWKLTHKNGSHSEVEIQAQELTRENHKLLLMRVNIQDVKSQPVNEPSNPAQALESDERISELLISNLPDLIFRFDDKGTYLDLRGRAENLLYVPKNKFLGKTVNQVLPEETASLTMASLKRCLQFDEMVSYEYSLNIKDRQRFFESRLIPINAQEVLAIIRDITEQKLTEERLRESDLRWHFALEGNGDSLWDWNIANKNVYYSPQWSKLTGYKAKQEEWHYEEWQEIILTEDKKMVLATIDQSLKNQKKSYNIEYRIITKDGKIKWILDRAKVVECNQAGEATRMIGVMSDITERKQNELKLIQQKQEIESFFELSIDLLAIIDSKGQFIKMNRCWSEILNKPVEHLIGRKLLDFVHPEDKAETLKILLNLDNENDAVKFTCRFIAQAESIRFVEWHVSKHQHLIYAAASDVTDKILAHNELIDLNQRLSQKEQMLQLVLDLIPMRVFWKDKNGRYLGGNKSLLQDAQLSDVNDLIGKRDDELVWKNQAKRYQENDKQVLETGLPKLGYEEFQENAALNESWLRTSKVPIFDESGQVSGLLGIYEDITKRKQTEEALISNEAFLRKLLRTLNKGLLLDDNKQLVEHIVAHTLSIFEADNCFFIRWDEKNERGIIEATQKISADYQEIINQNSINYFFNALMSDEQVIPINDVGQSKFFSSEVNKKLAGKSLIGVPIIAGVDKIGALIVCYSSQKTFNISEIERANLASGIFSLLFGRNSYFSRIKENEQMLSLLIEKSPIGIATVNSAGYYLMCNAEFEKMFGYTQAELQKMNIQEIINPEYLQLGQKHFSRLNDNHTSYVELQTKRRDGALFWSAVHAVKMTDEIMLGFHIDITESIESKNALAHEKAMLNNLLQSMPDLVFYKDLEGKFLGGNHLLEKQLGKPIHEIIGKKDKDFLSAEISAENQKVNQQIIQTEETVKVNEILTFPEQKQIAVETTKAPLYDQNNKIIGLLGISRDISERIAYEKALKESDTLLKQLTVNVPGIIFQLQRKADLSYHFPYVSKGIERIFEFPPEALVQNSNLIFEQVVDEDKEAFSQSIRASFDSLEEWKSDFRIKLSDNRIKYLRGNAMPSILEDKSIIWHGHIMDITLQHNIEQQLGEQQETINTIFRSLEEVIYSLNLKTGKLDFISPSCEQLFGYGPELYRAGFNFHQKNIHPDDLPNIIKQRDKLITDGRGVLEYRIITKSGNIKWIMDKAKVITGADEKPIRVEGIMSDITASKNFELALAASEERFDMAMRYTDAGVWDWDLEKNKVFYTDTWKTMLGYQAHEIGDSMEEWQKRWHPDDKPVIEKTISDYMQGNSPRYSIEHRLRNKQGEWQWILTRGILFRDKQGNPMRWLGTNIDISERKKLENNLKYRAKLQHILMMLANNLINLDTEDVEKTIDDALEQVGRFVNADRAYIFSYDMETNTSSNIYEWCAEGIIPQIENLQDVPVDFIPHWVNTHKAGKSMIIEDVMALPKDDGVRLILEPQGVQSLITVPMIDHKNLVGFIGFDSVRTRKAYSETEKELLLFMAELIVNAQTRQRYTQELEEQKNMLSMATEASNTAIYSLDLERDKLRHDKQMISILGNELADVEIDSQQYLNFIHPNDLPAINNTIENLLNGKSKSFDLEYRIKLSTGNTIWVQDKGSVVEVNSEGKPIRISGTRTNINTRKLMELELQQSEKRFKSLYQNAMIGLYRTTPQGEIIMANPTMANMLGYDNVDELKKLNLALAGARQTPKRDEFLKLMDQYGELRGFENVWRRKDGTPVHVYENATAIKDEENNIIYFDGSVEDITQRQQALDALKESEERFRQLAENIDDIIWLQEGRKVVYVNPAFERMTGYDSQLLLSNSNDITDLIFKDDLENFNTEYGNFIKNPAESWILRLRYYHQSGDLRWLNLNLHLLIRDTGEKDKRIIGVATDITEQKKVEEQLQVNLKMERELGELKTRFVSMASHELRTPLATIMATTETLLAYHNKMNSEQLQQRLTKILDQSVFLKDMMNGVLDLSKIQQGRTVFNPKYTDAVIILREIVDEFESHPNTHQKIVVNTSDTQIQFMLDTLMFRQIIYNLLSNAIKYSAGNSEIWVTLNLTETHLILAITDQGIGIPKIEQIHLFDAFFRASNSSEIKGTGLGMPILKESVEYHGGTIDVKSALNKGTTISCYFPKNNNLQEHK
ncbi:MAG: PAS domain S-box protein [Bacteroidales bacterium]|jgi:PAS domain S-box-containing protein|nr:PAS domain S-box protein [Bacteroidales bacterium]